MAVDPHVNPASGVWDDNYYAQTHSNGGSSSSGGSFTPLAAPDVAKIENTVATNPQLVAYYTQLLKEANGDFNRAVTQLRNDYVTGVRNQKIQFAYTRDTQLKELTNTLNTLGITNVKDQNDLVDQLNKRGMAVTQNNPDGTPNALKTSNVTADNTQNPDGTFTDTSNIDNPASANTGGQGAYELAQLQTTQKLQQEAQQRAATKPIEQAGINLKQYTNLPAGIDPNLPPDQLAKALAAPGVDRSSLGSAESNLVTGTETQTRDLQKTQEDLANQRASDISGITSQVASTGSQAGAEQLTNQDISNKTNTFVNTGA